MNPIKILLALGLALVSCSKPQLTLDQRLEQTSIDQVEFNGVSLEEFVKWASDQSSKHDPTGQGINFRIETEGFYKLSKEDIASPTRSLTLKQNKISLEELLKLATALSNTRYKIDKEDVVICNGIDF